MRGINLPQQKCRGAILMELAHEIKELKEELEESTYHILQYVKSALTLLSICYI